MFADIARQIRPVFALLGLVAAAFLAACDFVDVQGEANTPVPGKPVVTLIQPQNGTTVAADSRVHVSALIEASQGITHLQLRVNDSIVDDLSLVVATRRFDYQRDINLSGVGQNVITLVVIDANGVASDPVAVAMNVEAVSATIVPKATATVTLTPFVIYVTATGLPAPTATHTPYVVYWTATPQPSVTYTPTRYIIYETATTTPTVTLTLTPWRVYVTATLAP